jgi:hypothetical protein
MCTFLETSRFEARPGGACDPLDGIVFYYPGASRIVEGFLYLC